MSPPVRLLKTVRLLETLEYSLIYFQVQLFPVPYFIPEFQHNNFEARSIFALYKKVAN